VNIVRRGEAKESSQLRISHVGARLLAGHLGHLVPVDIPLRHRIAGVGSDPRYERILKCLN
jgi:hypothetical protein